MGRTLTDFVIQQLVDGGASTSDIVLARKRIQELANTIGNRANIDKHILACVREEFGVTTPQIEKFQQGEAIRAFAWFGESNSHKERNGD